MQKKGSIWEASSQQGEDFPTPLLCIVVLNILSIRFRDVNLHIEYFLLPTQIWINAWAPVFDKAQWIQIQFALSMSQKMSNGCSIQNKTTPDSHVFLWFLKMPEEDENSYQCWLLRKCQIQNIQPYFPSDSTCL